MSRQTYEQVLNQWIKDWKKENLSPEVIKLIDHAHFDLWHGPCKNGSYGDPVEGDPEWETYPGFTKACQTIRESLDSFPRQVFLDLDTEWWQILEPEREKCETCNGEGTVNHSIKCTDCNGMGSFDPAGDWYLVEQNDLRAALLGKELVEYIF